MTIPFSKVLCVEDFDELATYMQAMFPFAIREGKVIPHEYHRKWWEAVMALRAMTEFGVMRPDARVLGMGAGQEPLVFWLTAFVEVHATDLYADGKSWAHSAPPAMLVDPQPPDHPPLRDRYNRRRLIVQHMDARDLRYPDNTFDATFSSSSIEHVEGELPGIAQAARELGRVLKPGGILTLATEFRLDPPGNGWPGTFVFLPETLQEWIVEPSGCEWVDTPDYACSPATRATEQTLDHALYQGGWPHVVINYQGCVFTSVFITLRKPGGTTDGDKGRTRKGARRS